jgi:hypothetical protein
MSARRPISDRKVLVIGIWNFDIVWNLSLVIWDFSGVSGKVNLVYLNQLELTLTIPWLSSQLHFHFISSMVSLSASGPQKKAGNLTNRARVCILAVPQSSWPQA